MFISYTPAGEPLSGDTVLDSNMKARTDDHGGYIINTDTGEVVYGTKPEQEKD